MSSWQFCPILKMPREKWGERVSFNGASGGCRGFFFFFFKKLFPYPGERLDILPVAIMSFLWQNIFSGPCRGRIAFCVWFWGALIGAHRRTKSYLLSLKYKVCSSRNRGGYWGTCTQISEYIDLFPSFIMQLFILKVTSGVFSTFSRPKPMHWLAFLVI